MRPLRTLCGNRTGHWAGPTTAFGVVSIPPLQVVTYPKCQVTDTREKASVNRGNG